VNRSGATGSARRAVGSEAGAGGMKRPDGALFLGSRT
jgi:hypothetical protein